ncbi:MAG: CRISPR-associated endonuclease Cas2 [Desulfurococcales archaeon]|nr:CRISPR-associated endonuclease Cas2 [Desulfurococcales archaeon]
MVYDIHDNNLRNKIAEILKDNGLVRIQKSAFIGNLTPQERLDLVERLHRLPLSSRDRIDLFPICERDLKLHLRVTIDGVSKEVVNS